LLIDWSHSFCLMATLSIFDFLVSASGELMMIDDELARLRAHRNNIHRYRRLLQTHLTVLERNFIERRLSEEEAALKRLASSTLTLPDMSTPQAA
jgi:hypothetical protein